MALGYVCSSAMGDVSNSKLSNLWKQPSTAWIGLEALVYEQPGLPYKYTQVYQPGLGTVCKPSVSDRCVLIGERKSNTEAGKVLTEI